MKARQRRKLRQWAARAKQAGQTHVAQFRGLKISEDDGADPGRGYINPDVDPDGNSAEDTYSRSVEAVMAQDEDPGDQFVIERTLPNVTDAPRDV